MPTARKLLAGLALAFTAISCSEDRSPTSPAAVDERAPTAPVVQSKALLTNRAASGPLFNVDANKNPTTPTGNSINGTVTITRMAVDQATRQLLVSGTFTYQNAGATVVQSFTNVPATLTKGASGPTQPTCRILELDIGAIHLDLLGLVVDLAPIHLDIVAQSGPGNLLGNLLCALAGLLDPGAGGLLGGLLTAIQNLLNQINAILGGL